MKLLGWMHRKFRQNAGDPLRDFPVGHPCNCLSSGRTSMDADHHHYANKHMVTNLRAISDKWLFSDDLAGDPDEDHDSPPELFDGLLAIGTLGRVEGDVVTPTFAAATPPPPLPPMISVEAIFEKEEESDPSEMDLMVINSELEKVLLIPEAEKGGGGTDRLSSARASHVSAKHCPLQEYLLGSAVLEVAETVADREKRQDLQVQSRRHTSLGELFMKTKAEEEDGGPGTAGGGKKGVQMMVKKMLKKKGGDGGGGDGTKVEAHHGIITSEKKFHKIMHIFHKKVHPEPSSAARKPAKTGKPASRVGEGCRRSAESTGNPVVDSMRALRKDGLLCLRSHSAASDSSSVGSAGTIGDSNGNREHWIKTDAEYLVLEL